jgi:hypothetical protein
MSVSRDVNQEIHQTHVASDIDATDDTRSEEGRVDQLSLLCIVGPHEVVEDYAALAVLRATQGKLTSRGPV